MSTENPTQIHATGDAAGFSPAPGDKGKPKFEDGSTLSNIRRRLFAIF
jgi:hypothetical protein